MSNAPVPAGVALNFLYPEANYAGVKKRLKPRRVLVRDCIDIEATPRPDVIAADPLLRRSRWLIIADDLDLGERRKFYSGSMEELQIVRPETQVHFLGDRYGNHYNVVWIETDEAWHHGAAELPDEFHIAGTLISNVSTWLAETIASRANLDCDLVNRRGRWAIVVPAELAR
jgi:hypothetical protein